MILDFIDAMILDLFDDLGFPIPFLVQPYVFQTPSLQMGGFFVVAPLALPSAGMPWTQ